MTQLCRSYLFAYLVMLGIALGCLGLLLLHSLVGGEWGKASRLVLQAGADLLPWMAMLFFPLLVGVRHIYPWRDASLLATGNAAGAHKALYFNLAFFIVRAMVYFTFWIWIGRR